MKDLKIFTDNIEQAALDSIEEFMSLDAFKDSKVRIMPDVHAGKGCVIGFTATIGDKVIPNVVGVDIGCGMLCAKLDKQYEDLFGVDYAGIDKVIRESVPYGNRVHTDETISLHEYSISRHYIDELRCKDKLNDIDRLYRSMGSLGGGNHFIEISVDSENNKYVVIHSGSRNLGKQVCEIYQQIAINNHKKRNEHRTSEMIEVLKSTGNSHLISDVVMAIREYEKMTDIPDDLCYLEGKDLEDYLHDMEICQKWAKENRYCIFHKIFGYYADPSATFHTIHNYIDFGDMIVRKGAISAAKGEKVLIPMNMRDGSILAVGKGNEDWNCSAPHGAGRIMSRSVAKSVLDLEEYKNSMKGIYTTSVSASTIDEAPMAYKPMSEIIEKIGDTVEIIDILKPIYNFKAPN